MKFIWFRFQKKKKDILCNLTCIVKCIGMIGFNTTKKLGLGSVCKKSQKPKKTLLYCNG